MVIYLYFKAYINQTIITNAVYQTNVNVKHTNTDINKYTQILQLRKLKLKCSHGSVTGCDSQQISYFKENI